jgi:pimeloyl-ACP methyl ester carboxylesterase
MTHNPNYKSTRGEQLAMAVYQRTLDAWPVANEQRTIPTRHGDAFVISFGDAANPPLVLLHGSAANSSTWAGDATVLSERFRVHAIDLPGETGKGTPNRLAYANAAYVEWLTDALDGLEIERTSFAGLSLGGWASLKFAAHETQRVERLALIAPGGVVRAKLGFVLKAAAYQRLGTWGIRRITELVFGDEPPPPGVAEGFAFMLKHYRARHDTLPPLSDDELRRVAAPVYFVGGSADALLDQRATHDRLERLLPHFEGRVIAGGGHALLGVGPEVAAWLAAGAAITSHQLSVT